MEGHVVERVTSVDRGLGNGQPFEDADRESADVLGEICRLEQRPDVAPGPVLGGVLDLHAAQDGREAVALDRDWLERHGFGSDCVDGRLEHVERNAGADQCAEEHVATGTGRGVDPDRHLGAALLATRAAKTPAPYPLSMLTTVTPGAHELSMANKAASPPNEAP